MERQPEASTAHMQEAKARTAPTCPRHEAERSKEPAISIVDRVLGRCGWGPSVYMSGDRNQARGRNKDMVM